MIVATAILVLGQQKISGGARPTITTFVSSAKPAPSAEQLFSPPVVRFLIQPSPHQWNRVWPDARTVKMVPVGVIPKDQRDSAKEWLTRLLKPEYLPADLDQTMSGIRGYAQDDLIAFRYKAKDGSPVLVMETVGNLTITVKCSARPAYILETEPDFKDWVLARCSEMIKLPDGKLSDASWQTWLKPLENTETLFGTRLQIETEGKQHHQLAWWNDFHIFASGSSISFQLAKKLGTETQGMNQQGASYDFRPRFGNIN